jgi:RecA/RadA recombinase
MSTDPQLNEAPKKTPARKRSSAPKPKAATKKAAVKKATKPKAATKKVATVQLEDPSQLKPIVYKRKFGDAEKQKTLSKMTENVRKSIEVLNERSAKRPVKLLTPAMLRRALMPYEEIYFQYMLNSIGFRTPVAIEIIAQEKVGATTFVMDWISRLLDMGCYSVYIECEAKQMDDKRIKRLMDRDPRMATLKINSVEWAEARTLAQCDETIRKTVADLRKRCDADPTTKGNPIFAFVDPWGALMAAGEAKGNSTWGLAANAKKEAPKDSTDGSNFEHAKHAHRMARWLPSFMEEYNCSVVFVNKQNDKVDMVSKPRPGFAAPSPMKNDARVGGRALKRLCAYRMTMMKLDDLRKKDGDKKVYGHHLRAMLVANSYGPRDRKCEFSIYFDDHEDTPDYQAPGFSFDERTAAMLVDKKFLGITVNEGRFTCDAAGVVAVPAAELMAALRSHPDHLEYVGSQLGIEGYASAVVDLAPTPSPEEEEDEDDDIDMLVPADEEGDSEEVSDAS